MPKWLLYHFNSSTGTHSFLQNPYIQAGVHCTPFTRHHVRCLGDSTVKKTWFFWFKITSTPYPFILPLSIHFTPPISLQSNDLSSYEDDHLWAQGQGNTKHFQVSGPQADHGCLGDTVPQVNEHRTQVTLEVWLKVTTFSKRSFTLWDGSKNYITSPQKKHIRTP